MSPAVGPQVEVRGLINLNRNFDKAEMKIISRADQEILAGAIILEAEIKESISGNRMEPKSVDTGLFRKTTKHFHKTGKLIAGVRDGVNYGKWLEFGTSRIQPRMHFRNSTSRKKSEILNRISAGLRQELATTRTI